MLGVAAAEFAARGYEGASLNEILTKCGLGKSSYYYDFADKEDLYVTCIEDAFTRLLNKLPPLDVQSLTPKTFWPAIERLPVVHEPDGQPARETGRSTSSSPSLVRSPLSASRPTGGW